LLFEWHDIIWLNVIGIWVCRSARALVLISELIIQSFLNSRRNIVSKFQKDKIFYLTLTSQPHTKISFFKLLICSPLWVLNKNKILIFLQNWRFFLTCTMFNLFKQIYFHYLRYNHFLAEKFFLFWMQKIEENFISFRNMFLKNKKTCKLVE